MRSRRASLIGCLGCIGSFVLSSAFVVGCGSSIDVADPGGELDSGGGDDSGGSDAIGFDSGPRPDGAPGDSGTSTDTTTPGDSGAPSDTTPPSDTSPPPTDTTPPTDTPPTCTPLGAGATDVYVDKRYTGTSTGTAACPFTTINAGIAAAAGLSGTRTVHVAGATPALVYKEASPVLIDHNIILLGDGPSLVTISASGSCGGGVTCAVGINSGATIDGFTVISSGGEGIATGGGSPAPIVKNVAANGSKNNGILTFGAIEVGPNVSANRNGASGLDSRGGGLVHVAAGTNSFDFNGTNGIHIESSATLKFDGGTASNNTLNGIRLAGSPTTGTLVSHTITGLTANGNKGTGVASFGGQSLKIRASTLLTNSNYGLYFFYATGSVLDIGLVTDGGKVVFGGATSSQRNVRAGMYLCRSRGKATQPADSDSFSACAPTQTSLAGCDTAPASYTDVAYAPNVAGDPVDATACTVGP